MTARTVPSGRARAPFHCSGKRGSTPPPYDATTRTPAQAQSGVRCHAEPHLPPLAQRAAWSMRWGGVRMLATPGVRTHFRRAARRLDPGEPWRAPTVECVSRLAQATGGHSYAQRVRCVAYSALSILPSASFESSALLSASAFASFAFSVSPLPCPSPCGVRGQGGGEDSYDARSAARMSCRSAIGTRRCSIVSRSRIVTWWSSRLSKSTVTQ